MTGRLNLSKMSWTGIWAIVFTIIALAIGTGIAVVQQGSAPESYNYRLKDGWRISDERKIWRNQNLDTFRFDHRLHKGERVLISRKVPSNVPWGSEIRIETAYSTLDIYVGDQHIYSYGNEQYEKGRFVGSGVHFVPLPDDAAGQTMRISFVSTEEGTISSFYPVQILPSMYDHIIFGREHIIVGSVGIMLALLGAVVMIISAVAMFISRNNLHLLLIGASSFLLGDWTIFVTKTAELFSEDLTMNCEMEHMTLFLAPIPILILIGETRRDLPRWKKWLIRIPVMMLTAFFFAAMVLHYTDTAHFPQVLPSFHLELVIAVICVLLATAGSFRKQTNEQKMVAVGIGVILACGVFEVARYAAQKYFMLGNQNFSVVILPFGMLAFIIILVMEYAVDRYSQMMSDAERDTLKRLAYEDTLTKLGNRLMAEKLFAEADKQKIRYALASIDLNNLKKTNDTYGHACGDELIRTFGHLLRKFFGADSILCRMGGDEFLVFTPDAAPDSIEERMHKMASASDDEVKALKFPLEFAYGVAGTDEKCAKKVDLVNGEYRTSYTPGAPGGDVKAEEVYHAADERMYEMKKTMKSARL